MRSLLMMCAVLLGLASTAAAFEMTPLELTVAPQGSAAAGNFRLENTGSEPIAVEVSVFARQMTAEGADLLSAAGNDFQVFPQQVVVMPGETQTIKVRYVGPPVEGTEKAYRLVAEQLPIDVGQAAGDKGGAMNLLVRYVASLYVLPAGAAPAVTVVAAEPASRDRMKIVLANSGSSHALLTNIKVDAGGFEIAGDRLAGLIGENLLAGVTRTFYIAWPKELAQKPVQLRLLAN